jgi:LmbE family N-acetylglucosaminyl deacetylase
VSSANGSWPPVTGTISDIARDRLLIVLAHPDDETFAIAATAARYAEEGRTVALVTLTAGGAGVWCNKPSEDPRALTAVRREELTCASRVLGIAPLVNLDYPDGALTKIAPPTPAQHWIQQGVRFLQSETPATAAAMLQPLDLLMADLLGILRRVRPEVVVTFGPDGLMGGHPDHRATHRLVRLAWQLAQREDSPPRKLYYLSAPPSTVVADRLPRPPRVTTHVFVRDFQARKRQAFACYASQSHEQGRLDRFIHGQGDWEVFSLAEGPPGPKDESGLEADLFA